MAIRRYYSNECASTVRPFQSLDTHHASQLHCTALRCHISDAQIIIQCYISADQCDNPIRRPLAQTYQACTKITSVLFVRYGSHHLMYLLTIHVLSGILSNFQVKSGSGN